MTLTEYAAHRGVTKQAISKLKGEGKLSLDGEGRVQVMATDALLAQVLHPTKGGKGGSRAASEEQAPSTQPATGKTLPAGDTTVDQLSYTEAARAEKLQRVRLLGIEIAERCGKLVDREAVDRQAFTRARQALDALLAITDRLAPQLAAESDPHRVHVMLDTELRRVAQQIADAAAPQQQPEAA